MHVESQMYQMAGRKTNYNIEQSTTKVA